MTASRILEQNGRAVIAVSQGDKLQSIVEVLTRNRISAVLVLDSSHKLAGIISERDVVRVLANGIAASAELTADKIMTRTVHTCAPDDFESDLVVRMIDRGVRHLPVVSRGEILGMVSMRDVLTLRMKKIDTLLKSIEREAAEVMRKN